MRYKNTILLFWNILLNQSSDQHACMSMYTKEGDHESLTNHRPLKMHQKQHFLRRVYDEFRNQINSLSFRRQSNTLLYLIFP